MAEASMVSQEIALLEAKTFEAIIQIQQDDFFVCKEDTKQLWEEQIEDRKQLREDWIKDMKLMAEEWKQINVVLQKVVEKLCPKEDPAD